MTQASYLDAEDIFDTAARDYGLEAYADAGIRERFVKLVEGFDFDFDEDVAATILLVDGLRALHGLAHAAGTGFSFCQPARTPCRYYGSASACRVGSQTDRCNQNRVLPQRQSDRVCGLFQYRL